MTIEHWMTLAGVVLTVLASAVGWVITQILSQQRELSDVRTQFASLNAKHDACSANTCLRFTGQTEWMQRMDSKLDQILVHILENKSGGGK